MLVVALTVLACFAVVLSFRKTIRRALWGVLVEHGIPCCKSCGYSLTGLPEPRCPECGTEFER